MMGTMVAYFCMLYFGKVRPIRSKVIGLPPVLIHNDETTLKQRWPRWFQETFMFGFTLRLLLEGHLECTL